MVNVKVIFLKVIINGVPKQWNSDIANDVFLKYILNNILDIKVGVRKANNNIDDNYEWDNLKKVNQGKAREYKKIYKQALDKIKDTTLRELLGNKKVKKRFNSVKLDDRIMDYKLNELTPSTLKRMYEFPLDSKETKVQLKKGVEDYDSYFDDLYNITTDADNIKRVKIDELNKFKDGDKFKTLVNLGFTNIKLAEPYTKTSGDLKRGGKNPQLGTDTPSDLVSTLTDQVIPLVVETMGSRRTVTPTSAVDPIVVHLGKKYEDNNKEEVAKYRQIKNLEKKLRNEINRTFKTEYRKMLLDFEDEKEREIDRKLDEVKDKKGKEVNIVRPTLKDLEKEAKKQEISNKLATELFDFQKEVEKLIGETGLTLLQIFRGTTSPELLGDKKANSIDKFQEFTYEIFFDGKDNIFEESPALEDEIKQMIETKKEEVEKMENEFYKKYKDAPSKFSKDEKKESFEKTKTFLKRRLKPYLNDLENVYKIDFEVKKTKTKKSTNYEIKRLYATPTSIIFQGGSFNPKKKKTRIIESRVDISHLNTFINSILSRVKTLEVGI
jgi:hypothetical protein|tara:strand:+ start:2060 stop:3715 length:1656 start_codon:yes stop_codon:yes gene_type:complete